MHQAVTEFLHEFVRYGRRFGSVDGDSLFSLITFADNALIRIPAGPFPSDEDLPTLTVAGACRYSAGFDLAREALAADRGQLPTTGDYRPQVFLVTSGDALPGSVVAGERSFRRSIHSAAGVQVVVLNIRGSRLLDTFTHHGSRLALDADWDVHRVLDHIIEFHWRVGESENLIFPELGAEPWDRMV